MSQTKSILKEQTSICLLSLTAELKEQLKKLSEKTVSDNTRNQLESLLTKNTFETDQGTIVFPGFEALTRELKNLTVTDDADYYLLQQMFNNIDLCEHILTRGIMNSLLYINSILSSVSNVIPRKGIIRALIPDITSTCDPRHMRTIYFPEEIAEISVWVNKHAADCGYYKPHIQKAMDTVNTLYQILTLP